MHAKIHRYRTFAKECVINNSELFSYEKRTNLAYSTFNLYVLYIKLAQNTKQCRRLVLENFITAIHFLFGRKKKHFMGLGPGFVGC